MREWDPLVDFRARVGAASGGTRRESEAWKYASLEPPGVYVDGGARRFR